MRDKECSICSRTPVEECHVMDKAELIRLGQNHDFFNIIPLCSYCHHELFDNGRVAMVVEKSCFIVLYGISGKNIEILKSRNNIAVMQRYIEWKNLQCHTYLQAVLRKCKKILTTSQDKLWPCCNFNIIN